MGTLAESHICSLLDVMFGSGLSSTLVDVLEQITVRYIQNLKFRNCKSIVLIKHLVLTCHDHVDSIPSLMPTIQDRLLDCISVILTKMHYARAKSSIPFNKGSSIRHQPFHDPDGSALVQLALKTLAQFNFKVLKLYLC